MNITKFLLTILISAGLLFCTVRPGLTEQFIDVNITDAKIKKINIAVPCFTEKTKPDIIHDSGKKMADLMGRALDFHGFINVIDNKTMPEMDGNNLRAINAEYIITGKYKVEGRKLMLELRLIDGHSKKMILGKRFRDSWKKQRQMILKFCDEAIGKITGIPGISSSKITFISDTSGFKEVYIADVLGDDIRQVTKHKHLTVTPRLSPKADKLIYTSYHKGNPNLYLINFKKSAHLTRAISRRKGVNYSPAWSPDEKYIILTMSKDSNPDLYKINTSGQIIKRLTAGNGINVSPCFSPDGTQITFVSDRTGEPQIYIMDLHTGHTRRVTYEGLENTTPAWSPDGKWIAYTAKTDNGYQICKIAAESRTPAIQLTNYWGSHESPCWSPDSRQISFTRTRNGVKKLCTITAEGQWLRELFKIQGNQTNGNWSGRLNFY
jgi:TolB protein